MSARATREPDKDAAFEALYAAHHRAVLAYCARRGSIADAWDAAAEVFVVAWRRFDAVPPRGEARPWLLGVAYRVLANQRRSTHRWRRLVRKAAPASGSDHALPERHVIRNEEEREVTEALARLRPVDREILQARLWDELSPTETAAVLGISRAAVDQRFSRAKRRLARELAAKDRTMGSATPITEEGGAT